MILRIKFRDGKYCKLNSTKYDILQNYNEIIKMQVLMIKRLLQKRIDKIIKEANIKADKIIAGAKEERLKLISESALMETIKKESEKIKQKVLDECKEIKKIVLFILYINIARLSILTLIYERLRI